MEMMGIVGLARSGLGVEGSRLLVRSSKDGKSVALQCDNFGSVYQTSSAEGHERIGIDQLRLLGYLDTLRP